SKDKLDEANAEDIMNSLSKLKGSVLKAAQMLSMDTGLLPKAYADKFQTAQYSVPPLSYPLITRTFRKYFKKNPTELFDTFTPKAVRAASIGQVHKAMLDGNELAVKIQYPGVADSVRNDLKVAKPLAARLINIKTEELEYYMEEVEEKLIQETDYRLELKRSMSLSEACKHIPNIVFPQYLPEYSSDKIITMEWMDGLHLKEWLETSPSQEERNRIGQTLWDFYSYQVHALRISHADPHPGNFIITADNQLAVIDFGCVKEIPEDFYDSFFKLVDGDILEDDKALMEVYQSLNMIRPDDTEEEVMMFTALYKEMIELLGRPLRHECFDFSDDSFFNQLNEITERVMRDKKIRKSNAARGSRDSIYLNRIYIGLYAILNEIGAEVETGMKEITE
ncbi:MAG: AarF/ABC1/UbiB kinase family protein, partial [Saprospiraceae bacterium]|nr:AarF/ABC1/UbiB kinase family protein [Saprospiraceae bacterium]